MLPGMASITEQTAVPHGVAAGRGESLWIVGDTVTLMATAQSTGGSLTLLEVEASPGGGPPPHVHEHEDEAFYVLEGRFEILLGDELIQAGPGDFAFVPRGAVHRFSNIGDEPARILIAFTPGGMDGFFRAAGVPAVEGGSPPPLSDEEIARTDAATATWGMKIVGWG
jgi:quercetin dioxygenase-like cupin family protein